MRLREMQHIHSRRTKGCDKAYIIHTISLIKRSHNFFLVLRPFKQITLQILFLVFYSAELLKQAKSHCITHCGIGSQKEGPEVISHKVLPNKDLPFTVKV